jgi:hypothetical protein
LNSYFPSSTEGWFITWTLFELRRWLTDVTALSELARWFEEVEMSSFFDDRATLAMVLHSMKRVVHLGASRAAMRQ